MRETNSCLLQPHKTLGGWPNSGQRMASLPTERGIDRYPALKRWVQWHTYSAQKDRDGRTTGQSCEFFNGIRPERSFNTGPAHYKAVD